MTTAYKTLNGITGSYGHGDYSGYLPRGKRPGKWLPKVTPELCESGYHVCADPLDCLKHYGQDLWEVEVRGECVAGGDKQAWEQMRLLRRNPHWTDANLRLFAVDCARQVANVAVNPELMHACLDVVVACAEYGEAWDAAWAAARATVWDAARDAAWATAWATVWATARDAARAAARAAARDAARAAVWDAAARAGQRTILARYLAGEVGPLVEREDG